MLGPPGGFRPRFTLLLLYFALFFVGFCFLFVLPELLSAAQQLPPGGSAASEKDLEQAREIARGALSGTKLLIAFGAALAVTGLGVQRRVLPGLRQP
jgi:hypothetical protein